MNNRPVPVHPAASAPENAPACKIAPAPEPTSALPARKRAEPSGPAPKNCLIRCAAGEPDAGSGARLRLRRLADARRKKQDRARRAAARRS